ncbi:CGNR zinc finger domain-containing protein [Streptomyces sp. MI02-7b]|uniref:CGNR zinc finger domain-containing protein n=1 Tax=Streptomyces sp. MI02-7b TaxID=462941 RepID=UPI0029B1DDC3|nr:ABATE domain-containing protein [Streptomyces sp. MI02-7b]MDX3074027.1 ABATE domain-containing protein [Streptomyces sp. MI02-7b]
MERCLALELVSTIRHDGNGGVVDDLATAEQTAAWLATHGEPSAEATSGLTVDVRLHGEIIALRQAARALFARAVSPAPPSPADARRLIPAAEALELLNGCAAAEPVVPQLDWPGDGEPTVRLASSAGDTRTRLVATLARAVIDFLTGPDRARLRACTAPRCVRYFLKTHGRQEWCKPSCGNRARVARHYGRQRAATGA